MTEQYIDPRPQWAQMSSEHRWNALFMKLAFNIAMMSKDPSSQVGAVIAREEMPLSTGYNGFPRGVDDTSERLLDRSKKYVYVSHAEINAIFNASRAHVDIRGATIYCTHMTCCECAKAIIQSGISHLFYFENKNFENRWAESIADSKEMLEEAGVSINRITPRHLSN